MEFDKLADAAVYTLLNCVVEDELSCNERVQALLDKLRDYTNADFTVTFADE